MTEPSVTARIATYLASVGRSSEITSYVRRELLGHTVTLELSNCSGDRLNKFFQKLVSATTATTPTNKRNSDIILLLTDSDGSVLERLVFEPDSKATKAKIENLERN